jgi:hypothetical protein
LFIKPILMRHGGRHDAQVWRGWFYHRSTMLVVGCTTEATRSGNGAEGLLVTATRRMERRPRTVLGVRCQGGKHGHHRRYRD